MRKLYIIFVFSTFVWILFYSLIFGYKNEYNGLRILFSTLLTILIIRIYDTLKRRDGEIFGSIDRYIFIVLLYFLKEKNYSEQDILLKLKSVFKSYSVIQTEKLFLKQYPIKINLEKTCLKLKDTTNEAKLFVIYSLFNLSAADQVISIEEEAFIRKISISLRIHPKTIEAIKKQYLAKGFRDEQDIIDEQNRQKAYETYTQSYLPFEAYQIMGISPTVTVSELKKIYRKLAKQYHPDKLFGQSDKQVQKAKDKFQEITEAYEIIKRHKGLN